MLKAKAIRNKKTGEFTEISNFGGTSMLFTSALPNLMPVTANIKGLKEYYDMYSPLPKEIDLDEFEMVELTIIDDEVGADIRNKLSSPKNLVTMLKHYFSTTVDDEKREKLLVYIKEEMKQTKISIDYLSKLL